MARRQADWEALRLQFITDPSKPTLENFCGTHELSLSTGKKRSATEKWMELRNQHWNQVELKATDRIADYQSVTAARDTAQQISHIQAMKQNALKYAGGLEGQGVAYEKPHEAVAAYERLVKLERLILGESTEHIKVDDARQMVAAVIQILKEEVSDTDALARIATRLSSLGPVGPGSAEPHRSTLH